MGRVNLEERVFGESRLDRLAAKMSWPKAFALGALSLVWHDSQAALMIEATEEEIADWTLLPFETAMKFVAAATKCGYFVQNDGGRLVIQGNEVQIEAATTNLARAGKGGAATRAKWLKLREAKGLKPAASPPEASSKQAPARPNSMQGNAMQINAVQEEDTARVHALIVIPPSDPGDRQIAEAWLAHGLAACPWKSEDASYSVDKFAVHVGKLRRVMGFSVDQTMAILEFVRTDGFWNGKATSPGGLLKRKDNGERKIDNILRAIKDRGGSQGDAKLAAMMAWARDEEALDAQGRTVNGDAE